uniref:Putative ESAG8-associated protein n=1 Tax=Trypanosoma congolense (strain IL3000) TaxID=1068625 RepID=G0UNN3_TRYCI|nr:putative ESAG8-associated protein [Trypanosoma congolense IL3000]
MEMTHYQSSPNLDTFSSFLREVTNMSGGSASVIDVENKENIPPGFCGRVGESSNNNRGVCRSSCSLVGQRKQQQQQQLNASRVSGCCTPMKENPYHQHQQQGHSGLTPGNNHSQTLTGKSYAYGTNAVGYPLLEESDVSDGKTNSLFTSPVKYHAASMDRHAKLCEVFQECVPMPKPVCSLNESIEAVPLIGSVLHESDEEDDLPYFCPRDISPSCAFSQHRHEQGARMHMPESSLYQQQVQEEPHTLQEQQRLPPKERPHFRGSAWCETPPQHNVPAERSNTVTRVTHGCTPLFAVGGRRVPIDKLHLLLASSNNDAQEGKSIAADTIGVSPLVPTTRPTPSSSQTLKVIPLSRAPEMSSSLGMPIQDNLISGQVAGKRRALPSHHRETVVIEFGKGNFMRFKSNSTIPPAVVGKRYLVAVRASRSPYDNVAYRDAGVCAYILRHQADGSNAGVGCAPSNSSTAGCPGDVERGIFDGTVVRCMDTPDDIAQLHALAAAREAAIVECRKHFQFLNLPFELVDVHYTFDQTICVVYYNIQRQEGTSGHPNVPRLVRMLQFKLRCKVHLKGDFCSV